MDAIWCYYDMLHEGVWLTHLSGMVDVSSYWVNTDWKYRLSMLALVTLLDRMNPSLSCSC